LWVIKGEVIEVTGVFSSTNIQENIKDR
jgi:hypothetical protein